MAEGVALGSVAVWVAAAWVAVAWAVELAETGAWAEGG